MQNKAKRTFTIGTYMPVKAKSNRAVVCGFSSDISFRFAFRRVFGVHPTSFR